MSEIYAAAEVPVESEVSRRLSGAHFHDCYSVPMQSEGVSALALYLDVVRHTPAWVDFLMAVRNRVVALFGLKNLGHLGSTRRAKPVDAYKVGDRVGIFSVLYLTAKEVILGDADKHLNVQVSVCKVSSPNGGVAVSTVVHIHNLLGRIYMLPVVPIHKYIVQAMLRRFMTSQRGS